MYFYFMEKIIEEHLHEIKRLLNKFGVERAYLFGSAAKGIMEQD